MNLDTIGEKIDDIEVSIPDINSQVGYYYICAK